MAEERAFLGRHAVRRGPVAELEQRSDETLRIMPSGFWTGTLAVRIDATSIQSTSALRARLQEISQSLMRLNTQHWHTNQPAFSVWICDLFECGPGNIETLAAELFGKLVKGTLYIDETNFDEEKLCGLSLSSPNAIADCAVENDALRHP